MQVHSSIESYKGPRPIVTMGTFDGMHPGHCALLQRVKQLAELENTQSVVLTFWPHPRIVLGQDVAKLRLLTTLEEKTKMMSETGIDHLIIVPFNKELANLTAEDFVEKILVQQLNTHHLIIGYNHRFGKGGTDFTNLMHLSGRLCFELSQFRHIDVNGLYPSSTKIRNFLLEGKIPEANLLLGYTYTITGQVTGGMKMGRKLSYPTANLQLSEKAKLVPPDGVYACRVKVMGKVYGGMVNIGIRPTVNQQMDNRSIEVHILDFNQEIYSEEISIAFITKTREEIKFPDIEALKEQLKKDETVIRELLTRNQL
ncbi:bifunctional riboflavin kinase/FAD synthetase [Geofilum rubicundum]|uniref:Riboflavin biosynthesis protein n=1 Tax=Geofilum rubicundum JCM 15548 TaxID=1236989 RepID=A0A0E9LUH8_9BACT|nr:bifunctional riboflavin kinase/FAD synthetase [Geofilum rubicundum]GAO29247.1 riboflavin kinase [Geofilum rubicundum JCM 15548]